MTLTPLNLPKAPLRLIRSCGVVHVICLLRKKKIVLTPEEWVRQHLIYFISTYRKYPMSLIKVEHGISVNDLTRRCDLVLYDKTGSPRVIVECKAPEISISQLTFDQAAHYNHELKTDFLFLSNGLKHLVFKIDAVNASLSLLEDLPSFEEL